MRLTLKNKINNSKCNISVKEFPFVIGRKEPAFIAIEGFEQVVTDAVSYLSRAHAEITFENGQLHITDKGSLNGTAVNNKSISSKKVLIQHGDIVDFSGKLHFTIIDESPPKDLSSPDKTIIVEESEEDKTILSELLNEPSDPAEETETENKTVYMTSATTFLDILTEDSALKKSQEDTVRLKTKTNDNDSEIKKISSKLLKKTALIVLPILAVLVIGFFLYNRSSSVQLTKLYKDKQFKQAAILADEILNSNSDDEQVQAILFNSVVRYSLSGFPDALEQGRFTEIEQMLDQASNLAQHNEKLPEVLKLLQLASELQLHFQNKNSNTLSFSLNDKEVFDSMQAKWKKNKLDYSSYLEELGGHLSAFSEVRRITYKNLNLLQQSKAGKLKAADNLLKKMQTHLNNNQPKLISQELILFKKKYPFVSGIDSYQNDLDLYLKIWTSLLNKDINTLIRVIDKTNFQHALFENKLIQLKETTLPSDRVLMDYISAEDAWYRGDFALATSLLQPLTKEKWGEVAVTKLHHYEVVFRHYQTVTLNKQQPGYTTKLIEFFKVLTPEDIYFESIFKDDLSQIQNKQLETATILFKKAGETWKKYNKTGPIKGILRLQNEISQDFRDRALLLTDAYIQTMKAAKKYKTYNFDIPLKTHIIHTKIITEAKSQVARMQNLEGALSKEVFQAKLNLLPKLTTE